MADDTTEEQQDGEEGGGAGGKRKLLIIIAAVVVVIIAGGVGWWLLSGDDEPPAAAPQSSETATAAEVPAGPAPNEGDALYVGMPRPFVFNVPGDARDRLVQIKVQLLVRGAENEELAKKHIPLIEGTLHQVFSSSTADALQTAEGKAKVQELGLAEVRKVLQETIGKPVVEKVLFTGFVLQ
ncbi:flagellar basal body-associated protein FliL [Idiomarina tyrosinivorans]|uniref:Flagellar protein FliL n=1 Tax=Idiomarina tyrosinivorans TaxID=1445662 RepID=A0A432ZSI9_9GAMM|nr:flagellar basal body-associated protein FliL [Idiomarina tyrosinivorans]RUO80884.1 flagellar basal body-associated protein FliL [Idiomarina tyrosinivorans]